MPIRRRKNYGRKKRPQRKFRRRYKRRIPRSPGPPAVQYVKLPYTDFRLVSLAASTLDTRSWSINSLFDPDVSGAGGQPLFFDQYATMYRTYRVYGAKYMFKVSFGASTNACYHPTVCVLPCHDATTYSTIAVAMQMKGAKYRNLVPASTTTTIKGYISMASLLGIPKRQVSSDDRFQADVSANPAERGHVHIYVQNNDGTNAMIMTCEIKIVYYCKFYDLKQVTAS